MYGRNRIQLRWPTLLPFVGLLRTLPRFFVDIQARWFRDLSAPKTRIHHEYLQLLTDFPIADCTTAPQRLGAIINVTQCSWLHLVPYMMLRANVSIRLFIGVFRPCLDNLDDGAYFLPSLPPAYFKPNQSYTLCQWLTSCIRNIHLDSNLIFMLALFMRLQKNSLSLPLKKCRHNSTLRMAKRLHWDTIGSSGWAGSSSRGWVGA